MVQLNGFQLVQNFPNLKNLVLYNLVSPKHKNKQISLKKNIVDKMY